MIVAEKTKIEWTDTTWSPIRVRVRDDAARVAKAKDYISLVPIATRMAGHVGQHCEHVSPGCAHCYAETNNRRCLPSNGTGLPYDRRSRDLVETFVDEKVLRAPLAWSPTPLRNPLTDAILFTRPRRIFVENQSDLFGDWIPEKLIDRVFAVMALCPQHIFQVLTKRPDRMLAYFGSRHTVLVRAVREALIGPAALEMHLGRGGQPPLEWSGLPMPNVHLGVSVERQVEADLRIPLLLETPAEKRFLSCEPLLGAMELRLRRRRACDHPGCFNHVTHPCEGCGYQAGRLPIDWIIVGGESGPGARPMHQGWALSLRDQCRDASVPFFFKQWGAWQPAAAGKTVVAYDGHIRPQHETWTARDCRMRRERKNGPAELDGQEWKEFPK